MTKATTITAKNISKKHITSFLNSEKNLRDKLQQLLVACMGHAQQHNNDFTLLSSLVVGLKERKTRNLGAITAYILDHVKGIHWTKLGDKSMGYKTIKGAKVEYLEVKKPWYEHKRNVQTVTQVDVVQRIKTFITTLKRESAAGHIKKGQEQLAEELQQILSSALPAKA